MKHRKLVVLATLAFSACLPVVAHADSGIYIGGGVSRSNIEDSAGNPGGVPLSESATGGKLFAGYKIDAIPLVKFAGEVGYRNLGPATSTQAGVDVDYRVQGVDYAVLAGVGLGPVDLMARVGGMNYKLEKNVAGVKNKYDGTAPVYGIGLWFTVFGIGLRAEYEKIDIDELDKAEAVSLSAFYQF